MALLSYPLQLLRQYKGALDPDLKFDTLSALTAYLTNSRRYAGQIVSCVETPEYIYVLNSTESDWIPLPSKTYVDNKVASLGSLKTKTTVRFATTLTSTGTYNNGTNGVGATLTISSSAWQAFDVNISSNVTIGDTFLFKNENTPAYNGIYTLTSGGWSQDSVFTRSTNFDELSEVYDGLFVFVQEGKTLSGCGFLQTATVTSIGVSDITFTQFNKSGVYTADEDTLTLTGMVFSIKQAFRDLLWKKDDELYLQAGVVSQPIVTCTFNGSNYILDVTSFIVRLYSTSDNTGAVKQYTIPALNQIISENVYYYLTVNYNNGSPISQLLTNNTLINHSDIINVYQFIYEKDTNGTSRFKKFSTGNYAVGLSNKTAHRLIHTERFGYQDGLFATTYYSGGLMVNITSGVLWYDGLEITIPQLLNNSIPLNRYHKVGGAWICSLTQYLNISTWNNGTNLVTLSNNKYAVNWLYAMVDGGYAYLIGEGDYSLSEAQNSSEPVRPEIINKFGKLIYRFIVQKDATAITDSKPYHTQSASGTTATDKESVIGLRLTDSPEFADVQITNLSQNSYFLNTAKSVLSAINSLFTSVSQFFIDTKNFSGNVPSERPKYRVVFSYVGGNVVATLVFTGANTTAFYKIFGKRMILTTSNISAYTTSAVASEGTWFFYIDATTTNVATPVLVLSKTPWSVTAGHCLLDSAKFNATTNAFDWQGYDKHSFDRNIYWHSNEHLLGAITQTNGALTHYNGLASTSFASNTDNNFGRALVQLASCVMRDEDLTNTVTHTDASVASTTDNPFTDYAGMVNQFLGFTDIATTGTTTTSIVFPTTHTLIAGQAIQVMIGNSTTHRGVTTITTGGTGTTFAVSSVAGMTSGDAIVIGARIPILYLATGGFWRKLATTSFLAVSGGVACDATTIASGVMQYNDAVNGGFVNMTANRFYCVFLVQTNHYSEPIKAILSQGQSSTNNLTTALSENFAQFTSLIGLSSLDIQEVVSIKRLTFRYDTSAQFTNCKAKLVDVANLNFRLNSIGNVSVGGGGSSVISASTVTFTSTGDVSSTEVQSAIAEIDNKKAKKAPTPTINRLLKDDGSGNPVDAGFTDSQVIQSTQLVVNDIIVGEQKLFAFSKDDSNNPVFTGSVKLVDKLVLAATFDALLADSQNWVNDRLDLTGNNLTGGLGQNCQEHYLGSNFYLCIYHTFGTDATNGTATWVRNRSNDCLNTSNTQDNTVINLLLSETNWNTTTNTKVINTRSKVGSWYRQQTGGYVYMCIYETTTEWTWCRIGTPNTENLQIVDATLIAELITNNWYVTPLLTPVATVKGTQGQEYCYTLNSQPIMLRCGLFGSDLKWFKISCDHITTQITLSNAQIKALTSAISLIPTYGSGYAVFISFFCIELNAGTEVLTVATDSDLSVRYASSSEILRIETTGLLDQSASTLSATRNITNSVTKTAIDNKAIEIINLGTQIAGNASNNATVTITITYQVVKI